MEKLIDLIDKLRSVVDKILTALISSIFAYFAPIHDIFCAIGVILLLNFVSGLVTGILRNNEAFDLKKAFVCMIQGAILFTLIGAIFFVGDKIDNPDGATYAISAIIYASIWFYSVNILRNMKTLFPNWKLIAFLYFVISVEFIKKIPYLMEFYGANPKETENE